MRQAKVSNAIIVKNEQQPVSIFRIQIRNYTNIKVYWNDIVGGVGQ